MLRLVHRVRGRATEPDEGSMILALTVVMVVTFAILGVLVTVSGGLNSARNDQNRINAFQYANAGIDQALYRLDRDDLPVSATASYTPTRCYPSSCGFPGSYVTAFTDSIVSGSSRFDVVAEATPDGQTTAWKVRSTGLDQSGRQRQAITEIAATPAFVNGFLTLTSFYTTGEQRFPAGYDSSLCPDPRISATAPGCDLTFGGTQPVPTRLGTNGLLTLAAATADEYFNSWQGVDMWGRATQEAADNDCEIGGGGQKCNDMADYPLNPSWAKPHTNQQPVVLPDIATTPCPNPTGTFDNVTIPPGRYHCSQLNLSGTITVGGAGSVVFVVDGAVTINSTAQVNVGQPTPRFRIYQDPAGPSPAGSFCGLGAAIPRYWGLLSAPRMEIDCSGSAQPIIYGAVIAQIYEGTGSHFEFHWDSQSQLVDDDGKYVVASWRECPPGTVDC